MVDGDCVWLKTEAILARDEDTRYVYAQRFGLEELQGALKQSRRPVEPTH